MKPKIIRILCFSAGFCGLAAASLPAAAVGEETPANPAGAAPEIVSLDLTYGLFTALAYYHELSAAESQGSSGANEQIIPVLKEIIQEFETEREKYSEPGADVPEELRRRLEKFDAHVQDFRNELAFRNKVQEYRRLLEKQKTMIEGQ